MKKIYTIFLLLVGVPAAEAQSNPAAQSLPYTQDFSSLAHSSTTYPDGWQGWACSASPGGGFNTEPAVSDRSLTASSTASASSGNVHNFNGKIGFLNTASLDISLCLSISTSGHSNIVVAYDAMTIRNPYNGSSNTRINCMELQYRTDTASAFHSFGSAVYFNNRAEQTTSVTSPQNSITFVVALPADCNNQPQVQLRWVQRQVSGSGSRPSFALDNIDIRTGGLADHYYWDGSGSITSLSSWGTNTDGSGSHPAGFTADNQLFHVINASSATLSSDWTISGTGSGIIIGDGSSSVHFTIPSGHVVNAVIDLYNGATLSVANRHLPALGSLFSGSGLELAQDSLFEVPAEYSYAHLELSHASKIFAAGNLYIRGDLNIDSACVLEGDSLPELLLGGNFILAPGAGLSGKFSSDSTSSGIHLVSTGDDDQVFRLRGNTLVLHSARFSKTAGNIFFSQGDVIKIADILDVNMSGTGTFTDSGAVFRIGNDLQMNGDQDAYMLTGALVFNGSSGTQSISSDISTPTSYLAAELNHVIVNTSGTANVSFFPTASSAGKTVTIKGMFVIDSGGTGSVNLMNGNASSGNHVLKIGGNYSNNRTAPPNVGINTILDFNGGDAQLLSSNETGGITLRNMDVSGGSIKNLGCDITISNSLSFGSGRIMTGDHNLVLSSSASVSGYSDSGYIIATGNGSLVRQVSSGASKTFPVGTSSAYIPAVIGLAPGSSADLFSVRVGSQVLSNGNSGSVISSNAVNATWFISENTGGGSNATVTLQWPASLEMTGFNRGSCYLSQYAGGWNSGPVSVASGSNPYTFSRSGITAFSPFSIGDNNSALPVSWLDISGEILGSSNKINWITASEWNNDHFEIESSPNGTEYVYAGIVTGAGNSSAPRYYHFLHHDASPLTYYRIRQVDLNGVSSFSKVISIKRAQHAVPVVYPNPASGWFVIPGEPGNTVKIINGKGQEVKSVCFESCSLVVDINQLPAGIYTVWNCSSSGNRMYRMVKTE